MCLQTFELQGNELHKVQETEKQARFKCGSFGASSLSEKQLATGSFQGHVQVPLAAIYTQIQNQYTGLARRTVCTGNPQSAELALALACRCGIWSTQRNQSILPKLMRPSLTKLTERVVR